MCRLGLSKESSYISKLTLFTLALLFPNGLFGQSRLKGNFISTHNNRWVYNDKKSRDDGYKSPEGKQLIISFFEKMVTVTKLKGFPYQCLKIISVKSQQNSIDTMQVTEFTYKLKDSRGHIATLFADIQNKGMTFKFDLFKGDKERITYTNNIYLLPPL